MSIQRSRQRRRFKRRDVIFSANFTNAQRDQPCTFSDHFRCAHFVFVILQRYRIVGRVIDNDIRFRHIGHHPTPCSRSLHLTDPPFNMGVAFALFELITNILPRHSQLFQVAEDLEKDVKSHHRNNTKYHQQRAQPYQIHRITHGGNRRLGH